MEHYDIAVIGAGPAGANFARLADSIRNRILIIDDDKQKKPCGGLLSPDAQKVLASYDISLPISVLASPQIFAVRVLDLDNGLTRRYPRHYLNMDRAAFDDLLRSLIPETVTVIRGRCASLADTGNGFLIRLADGKEYAADRLVGADGANSLVRRTFFPEKKHSFFTAIQEISPAQSMNPFYSCIFDSEISPAPSWLLFKNGVMIFGGAFSPEGCRHSFEKQKQKLVEYGIIPPNSLSLLDKTEACLLRVSGFSGFQTGNDRIFLIGEAAGFLSPSSFEGISYALRSGDILAHTIDMKKPSRAYWGKTASLRHILQCKECKRRILASPFWRRLILLSGITAIKADTKADNEFRISFSKKNRNKIL